MSHPVSGDFNSFLTADGHDNQTKSNHQQPEAAPPTKRKRNLPGMPDPDAEVIALSPKTLLATNRFVCEICNKGFQRDQNLQLHRRGHNLPWKLRQRSSGEAARKRVYVCPEPTCAHHDPSRALGDLTGIKKHFCRKHGEKKFKCDRCSKIYAVRSDWKAHMKTCGTREYPCDCGTLFSRRDTFITHRAFCDALAQENSRSQPPPSAGGDSNAQAEATLPAVAVSSPPPSPLTPPTAMVSPVLSVQSLVTELPENQNAHFQPPPPPPPQGPAALTTAIAPPIITTASSSSTATSSVPSTGGTVFATILSPSTSKTPQSSQGRTSYPSLLCPISGLSRPGSDPMSLSLCPQFYGPPSFFSSTSQNHHSHYLSGPEPALSATVLLQKAAQMSSTSSGSSFLRELGLAQPSSSGPQHNISALDWNSKVESSLMASGFSLASGGSLGLNDLMIGPSILGEKPTTLDFLGLGMGVDDQSRPVGFSAFLSSMGGGGLSNMGNDSFGGTWGDESPDLKPSL